MYEFNISTTKCPIAPIEIWSDVNFIEKIVNTDVIIKSHSERNGIIFTYKLPCIDWFKSSLIVDKVREIYAGPATLQRVEYNPTVNISLHDIPRCIERYADTNKFTIDKNAITFNGWQFQANALAAALKINRHAGQYAFIKDDGRLPAIACMCNNGRIMAGIFRTFLEDNNIYVRNISARFDIDHITLSWDDIGLPMFYIDEFTDWLDLKHRLNKC